MHQHSRACVQGQHHRARSARHGDDMSMSVSSSSKKSSYTSRRAQEETSQRKYSCSRNSSPVNSTCLFSPFCCLFIAWRVTPRLVRRLDFVLRHGLPNFLCVALLRCYEDLMFFLEGTQMRIPRNFCKRDD